MSLRGDTEESLSTGAQGPAQAPANKALTVSLSYMLPLQEEVLAFTHPL